MSSSWSEERKDRPKRTVSPAIRQNIADEKEFDGTSRDEDTDLVDTQQVGGRSLPKMPIVQALQDTGEEAMDQIEDPTMLAGMVPPSQMYADKEGNHSHVPDSGYESASTQDTGSIRNWLREPVAFPGGIASPQFNSASLRCEKTTSR